jgi:hypothetical protein
LDKGIHGIKVHSHRGQSSGFSFGEEGNDRGLDYSSKKMRELLASLPEGFIVEYHTQGSSSLSSTSRPFVVGKLAIENRHLKHIIVHSGAFGMRSFYPSSFNASLLTTAISQEMLVQEAVLMANRLPNVYCDSSTLIGPGHYKTDLLFSFTRKVSLSSDWPYSEVCPYGPVTKSEQLLARYNGADSVAELHTRAIDWLEKPMKDIFKEQGEIANVNNGRSQRYMEIRAELDSRKKKNR